MTDDSGCRLLHIDMDAFYAMVTLRDYPELRTVPMAVGGDHRGVVLSANYPARRHGVRSGMPSSRARRLCPGIRMVAPDFTAYEKASDAVMAVFASVTHLVEPLSMEEAFLDVSGATRRLGSPATIAERIRAVIADEQQITCSVGVATGKMVAKIASRQAKPDGVVVVPADETLSFLHPLPVEEIWGVGEKTAEQLHRLGIATISDIAHTSRLILQRVLGLSAGSALYDLAWGRDHRPVTPMVPDRSIGAEHTFGFDVDSPEVIERELLALTGRTARRMRSSGLAGRTVTVKIRFADFTTITRSRTLHQHTDVARDLYSAARATYRSLGLERARIRLVGVRVEGLLDAGTPRQLDLLEPEFGWRSVEAAADAAADRYGSGAVQPAALLNRNTG